MSTIPPVPVDHEAIANAIMVKVRELVHAIPGFGFAAKGRRLKINTVASLPDAFIEAVALACDTSPELSAISQMSAGELRDLITFSRAFTSLVNELNVIARGLSDTVAERRNVVGQRALRAYTIAKSINRPEERELLIPHLANMQRTLGRGRRKAKKAAPADPSTPAPVPTPAPAPAPAPPAQPAPRAGGSQ